MPTITFEFGDNHWTLDVEGGQNLLLAAVQLKAPLVSLCPGGASCLQCKVRIIEGAEHLSRPEEVERNQIGDLSHLTGERLACQVRTLGTGDVRLEIIRPRLKRKGRARPRTLR